MLSRNIIEGQVSRCTGIVPVTHIDTDSQILPRLEVILTPERSNWLACSLCSTIRARFRNSVIPNAHSKMPVVKEWEGKIRIARGGHWSNVIGSVGWTLNMEAFAIKDDDAMRLDLINPLEGNSLDYCGSRKYLHFLYSTRVVVVMTILLRNGHEDRKSLSLQPKKSNHFLGAPSRGVSVAGRPRTPLEIVLLADLRSNCGLFCWQMTTWKLPKREQPDSSDG